MKKMKLLAVVAAVVAAASQSASAALTFTDTGSRTAPAGTYSQTSATVPNNYSYYNTSPSNIGQSFTANSSGLITSISIKGAAFYLASGPGYGNFPTATFQLTLAGVDGSALSGVVSDSVSVPSGTIYYQPSPTGLNYVNYFTFTLATPYAVTADSKYLFDISVSGVPTLTYFQLNGTSTDSFAGGSALTLDSTTDPTVVQSTAASDLAFVITTTTTPVPEPSQWALVPVLGTIAFLAFRRFRSSVA